MYHCLEGISAEPTFGRLAFGTHETQVTIMDISPRGSELRAPPACASKQRTLVLNGKTFLQLDLGNQ